MKALILVGGFGTRLRPLTFSVPKPLVEFANKPISLHQIEALVSVGVTTIILAVNYKPDTMLEYLKDCEERFNVKIICSLEEEPLGTAGPVALAREHLTQDDEPFFMFNSDVITAYPLKEMLAFHSDHGKEGTILVTPVKDPSKYGVVLSDDNGKINAFIEKPQEFVSNKINAGLYLFNPTICNRIEPKPTSIEREIFPKMSSDNQLYSMVLPSYWMDVGQPKDFIIGTRLHLAYLSEKKLLGDAPRGVTIIGHVLIDPTAEFGQNCVIGPDVVIGPNVKVADGVRIINSTIFRGSKLKSHSFIKDSLIGWESIIGSWARCDGCVLGEDVIVKDEIVLHKVTVCPHKGVKQDEFESKIIL